MSVVVFCGPTIDAATVAAHLPGADCRPPAAQGDLYAACAVRPAAIALVDGIFLDRPSVWHREILAALDAGIPVWGAASMGALRAVECAAFGMIGVGKIFEAYRTGRYPPFADRFEDDDEVAMTHGPAALGWRTLSSALVDLRETLARAEAAGIIDHSTRDRLLERLRALPFPQRSFAALLDAAREGLGAAQAEARAAGLVRWRCSQKREDALALLAALGAPPPERTVPKWSFESTLEWLRFTEAAAAPPPTGSERPALAAIEASPGSARTLRRRAAARLAALAGAARPERLGATLGTFRHDRALLARDDLDTWLAANALSPLDLERLLGDEARLDMLAEQAGPERLARAMLDELRLDGRFAAGAQPGGGPQ